jgi:hypothetical protein
MKKLSFSTIFGICTMLIGAGWVLLMLIALSIFAAIPGGLAAYFGFHLIKEKNKSNIKGSVGALAVLGALFLNMFFVIEILKHIGLDVKHFYMCHWFLATIVAIAVYIPVSRFMMIREGLIPKPKGEFVGKGIIQIVAVQIWFAGIEIANSYAPTDFKAELGNRFVSLFLIVFAPLIVANFFYMISIKFIKEDKTEQSPSSNSAPANN